MARENRSWGYDRIQGSLKHLGYAISDQTVGNILKHHGIPPAPERKKALTWSEFVRPHLTVLLATDFFNSEVWSWFGLVISFLTSLFRFGRHPSQLVRTALHWPRLVLQAQMRQSFEIGLWMPEMSASRRSASPRERIRRDASGSSGSCV